MPEHETRVGNPGRKQVEAALASLDFPLEKEALVASVSAQGNSDESVLRQLRALPLATYASADEVLQSVEVADQRGR